MAWELLPVTDGSFNADKTNENAPAITRISSVLRLLSTVFLMEMIPNTTNERHTYGSPDDAVAEGQVALHDMHGIYVVNIAENICEYY